MFESLRKGNSFIDVAYTNGGYATLQAADFRVDKNDERVILSIDLSPNERVRNKDTNCYSDVMYLLEKLEIVESFQLHREGWIEPLASALRSHMEASRQLEIRFKEGLSHTYHYELKVPSNDLLLFAVVGTEQSSTNGASL